MLDLLRVPVNRMLLIAGIPILGLILAIYFLADTAAVAGLLGVLIGAGISGATSIIIAHENRRLQLQTAVLETRLAKHQEAYAIWREILSAVHDEKRIGDVVRKAEEWWTNNCLYLDKQCRNDIRQCMLLANEHKGPLQGFKTEKGSEERRKEVKERWETIMKPGESLVEAVSLPSLGEGEQPPDLEKPE